MWPVAAAAFFLTLWCYVLYGEDVATICGKRPRRQYSCLWGDPDYEQEESDEDRWDR